MPKKDDVVVQDRSRGTAVEEWKEYRFADLCDITRGASPRPIHEWISDQGIPWLKIADASATESRFVMQTRERIRPEGLAKSVAVYPGDLILSNSATPGIPRFVGLEACIHDGWLLLRNLRRLDKLFCYYLLLFERPRIVEQGSGTVFTNLKTDILKSHRVQAPAPRRAAGHCPGSGDAGRQDRAEPADERDAGGDGTGALQVVVRGLRPGAREDGRPLAARRVPPPASPPTSTTSSPTGWWTRSWVRSRRAGS